MPLRLHGLRQVATRHALHHHEQQVFVRVVDDLVKPDDGVMIQPFHHRDLAHHRVVRAPEPPHTLALQNGTREHLDCHRIVRAALFRGQVHLAVRALAEHLAELPIVDSEHGRIHLAPLHACSRSFSHHLPLGMQIRRMRPRLLTSEARLHHGRGFVELLADYFELLALLSASLNRLQLCRCPILF